MNKEIIKLNPVELKLQKLPDTIDFSLLDKIPANKEGVDEIVGFIERCKNGITDSITAYLNDERYPYYHMNLSELEKLLHKQEVDFDEMVTEMSLFFSMLVVYSLSEYYKNCLISVERNDHHAQMYQLLSSFAYQLYSDYLVEAMDFSIVGKIICEDSMHCMLYWFEFATPLTNKEWIV